MNLANRPNRRNGPSAIDKQKFGSGRRLSGSSAANIADLIWIRYCEARDPESMVTDPDALAQIIWEECGREIRGLKNLAAVEAHLCEM